MSDTSGAPAPDKHKPKLTSLFIGVGLAVAVLALVASVFFLLRTTRVVEPAALVVGDAEVSQKLYDEYVALGKKQQLSKKEVQDIVVEYEKNKQMATKYKVTVPDEYVKEVGKGVDIAVLQGKSTSADESILETAKQYNRAFLARTTQANQTGYGAFVYDIPANKTPDDAENKQAIDDAREVASKFREKIESKTTGAAEMLSEVRNYNAQNGQAAKTGVYFITEDEVPYDTAESKSVQSNAYILSLIKGKTSGLTDVVVSSEDSAFFVDVLYHQKKVENLPYEVQQAKEKIKVVVYDK